MRWEPAREEREPMPLYQYACRQCDERFERLVIGQARPACPTCGSENLERLLSVFAVGHGGGREAVPAATRGCGTCGDPRGPGVCARV
jgi:putative FmdB family regulatory protein